MNFENLNIWCWIIPSLVGIISGILGYLIGKGRGGTTIDNSAELKMLSDKNAKLEADLAACNKKLTATPVAAPKVDTNISSSLGATATDTAASVTDTAAAMTSSAAAVGIPFDASAAKAALGKNIKQDDLKVVEGIGPKIESMFKEGGLPTWKALSEAAVSDCQAILDTGGERYKVHNPGSWPLQAKMAYEGKWAELAKWQDEHSHGKL